MEIRHLIEKGYLSVDEVARYLGVKASTIYQWVKEGEIPHYKLHKMKKFKREMIDAWMENHRGDGAVVDKGAKRVLESAKKGTRSPKADVDGVVRNAIEEVRRSSYNGNDGNQTKVKGLRKEVKNGNL
jgi:excisionase family DNA binding protein